MPKFTIQVHLHDRYPREGAPAETLMSFTVEGDLHRPEETSITSIEGDNDNERLRSITNREPIKAIAACIEDTLMEHFA